MKRYAPFFVFYLTYTVAAFAATGDAKTDLSKVDVLPWYQSIEPFLTAAWQAFVVAAVPIFAALLYKFTGIKLEENDRAAIQHAAANAAGRIIAGVEGPISNLSFNLGTGKYASIIAAEAERIRATLPDELERRSITPEHLSHMIQGKLGQLQAGTVTAPSP